MLVRGEKLSAYGIVHLLFYKCQLGGKLHNSKQSKINDTLILADMNWKALYSLIRQFIDIFPN